MAKWRILRATLVAALFGFTATLALTPTGAAQVIVVQPINPMGEPLQFFPGRPAMYAVWHNVTGWHLRVTTAKQFRRFHGSIDVVDGTFSKVVTHVLEPVSPKHDRWRWGPGGNNIAFDFRTDRGVDGIHFQVSKEAKFLRFNLNLDGQTALDRVFIGLKGTHPNADPFYLPAHPKLLAG